MSDAKDLEIEISTDNVRALCEIGFDLGVEAARAAVEREGPSTWPSEIVNPFRRASTVVKQLERVEADAAANARARAACACTRDKLDPECDLHGVTAEMSEAMTLLEGLSENRRGRVLCWFCPACHRYVGPGDSCTCQAEE